MSLAQQIGRHAQVIDRSERANDFLTLARLTARYKGALTKIPTTERHSSRVTEILTHIRTAVPVGNISDATWGAAIAPFVAASNGFLESLRSASVFDGMLGSMRRAPMHSSFAISTSAVTGNTVAESSAKPVSALSINAGLLVERKAVAQVIASRELFRFATPAAAALVDSELRAGVIAASDRTFVAELIAATAPIASAGASTTNIYTDLAALLAAVSVGAASRVFLILHPDRAKNLILKVGSGGNLAFPNFAINGGEVLAGVTAVVTDQIDASAVLMVAADGIVADAGALALRYSEQAHLQLNTAPDSPPIASTTGISLWQTDSVALLCERFFAFSIARSTAVASLSSVAW